MVSARLKDFIFKKLYSELSHVEIIPLDKYIWFIDRDNKYWYFRYNKNTGELLWRHDFFTRFFSLFSMNNSVFTPIISSWVEDVLNHRVNTITEWNFDRYKQVEEVLNCRVNTATCYLSPYNPEAEEVLNHRVNTTGNSLGVLTSLVDEVLNYRVKTTESHSRAKSIEMGEVLNHKVNPTITMPFHDLNGVEEVLNCKV
jgi:hypothetical protein